LKTKTSNEEGSHRVVLQNKEVLAYLKSIDVHAVCNVLKHRQSLIDGTINPLTPFVFVFAPTPIPRSIIVDLDPPSHGPNVFSSPHLHPCHWRSPRQMWNICNTNKKNIECMASIREVDSKQFLILMQTHMQINFNKSKKVIKG
jgi:hypothetical protein